MGTLLPVMLNSGLNSDKSKPGQKITAKLKQDVPLPDHGVIKAGAEVSGRIVSVTRGSATAPAKLVFVADRLQAKGSDYPITTGLRALASMAAVFQARQPINGSSPDTVSVWEWNTRQIGGEIVFGGQRKVESLAGVVGTMVEPGWVVAVARPNLEAGCPASDNKDLQALWLFSTDACGVYGAEGLQISREPADNSDGHITLTAPTRIEVRDGAGLLLIVQPQAATGAGQR